MFFISKSIHDFAYICLEVDYHAATYYTAQHKLCEEIRIVPQNISILQMTDFWF